MTTHSHSSPWWQRLARRFLGWFDTRQSPIHDDSHAQRTDIDWIRSIPFFGLHLMCLGVIWVGWSPVAVAVAAAMYGLRMFAITGFYHRYFAHRTFKTNRFWQFVFALWGNSAVQKGPLWWAAHHRHHHRHSDQPEDIHSVKQDGFYWSHMGWITAKINFPTNMKLVKDLARYPELRWLDRFDTLVPILTGAAMFFLGVGLNSLWPQLGTSGMQMLIWGFFISTVVLFHGTCFINSLTHMWGRRRFQTGDESRNSLLLSFITLGEGWHNNHHYYPGATRQGFYWWEFDPTYYGLKLLSWLGIIRDLRPVPAKILEAGRQPVPEKPKKAKAAA